MADPQTPRFEENFRRLKDGDAIPADVDQSHLGENVVTAIGELDEKTVESLIQLAKTAGSHLFLHEKHGTAGKIIAMGL